MNRPGTLLCWAAASALTPLVLAGSGTAHGAGIEVTNGAGALRVMPGSAVTIELTVRNDSADPAAVGLQAVDVSEDENGCTQSERQAGDLSCASGGGELGDWLQLRLASASTGAASLWTGSLDELAGGVQVLDTLGGGESAELRLIVALPLSAPNDTMSDGVRFGLRWAFTAPSGSGG